MNPSREITLHIHCHKLPGCRFDGRQAVRLGIQKGKEVIQDVPANRAQVTFTVQLRVEGDTATGPPNFLGPFAQGTPQDRFLYLCWGERKSETWDGFRRAKVLLKHLTWQQIEESLHRNRPLELSLEMTDAAGGPVCGSMKLTQEQA